MSEILIKRCDGCGKEIEYAKEDTKTWFSLYSESNVFLNLELEIEKTLVVGENQLDFCSALCVTKFFQMHIKQMQADYKLITG